MQSPPRTLYALVDCSSFYCSCERAFTPELRTKPVVVLSNNDGCVIALTPEVKALGFKMGEPYFKVRDRLSKHGVAVFSSNYTLYADLSRRVMACLETFTPEVEVYSIDEAFLKLRTRGDSVEADRNRLEHLAEAIRYRVYLWTGIPVRVSIAETKTLAKVGSEFAKAKMKRGETPTVCFWEHPEREAYLASLSVRDVWGIGYRWGKKLEDYGLPYAADFAAQPDAWIRRRFNVVALRTALELRGVSCIELETAPADRKSMVRSRSFSEAVTDPRLLAEAISTHAARAAEKLRMEGMLAGHLSAFITTKYHGKGPHRTGAAHVTLPVATNRTVDLIRAAKRCLAKAYEATTPAGVPIRYRKAGVMLTDLRPEGTVQGALFDTPEPAWAADQAALMEALDQANKRFGKRAVVFGAMGAPKPLSDVDAARGGPTWAMKRQRMSPRYTTDFDELLVVGTCP